MPARWSPTMHILLLLLVLLTAPFLLAAAFLTPPTPVAPRVTGPIRACRSRYGNGAVTMAAGAGSAASSGAKSPSCSSSTAATGSAKVSKEVRVDVL
jgi:hypothetical protein